MERPHLSLVHNVSLLWERRGEHTGLYKEFDGLDFIAGQGSRILALPPKRTVRLLHWFLDHGLDKS